MFESFPNEISSHNKQTNKQSNKQQDIQICGTLSMLHFLQCDIIYSDYIGRVICK